MKLGETHEDVVAITAAMAQGTGLVRFEEAYPKRFFDVGIAEQHAVTFAAGMAAAGMVPVVAIYSSFLQRSYDQILHDVCLQKLHVIWRLTVPVLSDRMERRTRVSMIWRICRICRI